MVDWKSIYRRYQVLQRAWSAETSLGVLAPQTFRQIVHGGQSEQKLLAEMRSYGLEPPRAELIGEALYLRSVLEPPARRPDGRHPDDPLEDVYAAALSMLPHGFWVVSPDRAQLYRGQRDMNWATIPSIFRSADLNASLDRLACALPRIRSCLPDASEEQAIAIAQHYATELGVQTWLLDMTYDPRVALFFASDGGRTGDVGMVVSVVAKEWNRLSAGGANRLGRLHVVDAPGVLRIEHQRASFLDTSHPELFDQYVGHTVWFRQVDGLRFEDPDAEFPVTGDRIYPSEDPLRKALLASTPSSEGTLEIRPASDARDPLDGVAYFDIAASWCREDDVRLDGDRDATLRVVCDVYAQLQQRRDQFALADRSLARLKEAVDVVVAAQRAEQSVSPRDALKWTLSRLAPGDRARLDGMISACERARPASSPPGLLTEELLKMDGDIGELGGRRVALLGFRDPSEVEPSHNDRITWSLPGWTFVDARQAPGESLMATLDAALDKQHLALIVDISAPVPTDALQLIRALHDSRDSVVWTSGTSSRLPARRVLHVVAMGAGSIEDLPRTLQQIDFMTFVRSPSRM